MKIKNVSCTQFAGVRDTSVEFKDGINVVCGKNESGKSTLVSLIARTLFQNARLDKRSDKEFFELYFPSAQKDGAVTGDFIDGKVSFESNGSMYTVSKEWGAEPRCTLITPDGSLRSQQQIDELLRAALVYGEGVYTDMLFPSQRNADTALRTILDASKRTEAKQAITDAVTMAFAESGGVSLDAIEQAIENKIRGIEGLHWDFEQSMPVRKAGRWARDLGEILKAYYALQDAEAELDELSKLQEEADAAAGSYDVSNRDALVAEEELSSFSKYADRLRQEQSHRERKRQLEAEIKKYTGILNEWPNLMITLDKARILSDEKQNRDTLDRYEAATALFNELRAYKSRQIEMKCPQDEEVLNVKRAAQELDALSNKLRAMNLTADMTLLSSHTAEVRSLLTGEKIEIDKNTPITEAVSIVIPDVIELKLSPADVDVNAVRAGIDERQAEIDAVYEKYGVKSVEELEAIIRSYKELKTEINAVSDKLSILLNGTIYEVLEAQTKTITDIVRTSAEIDSDIFTVCGGDVQQFITRKETQIAMYARDYESIDSLTRQVDMKKKELAETEAALNQNEDIPMMYRNINDPAAQLEILRNDVKQKQLLRERALAEKAGAAGRLEAYRDGSDTDYEDNVLTARRVFNEQKELLAHWYHIREVFREKRGALSDNPMQDIAEQFTEYLALISDGGVSSQIPDSGKLDVNVYSKNRLMDYNKLSEGTKETVFLAFRLAALDHLFPLGGGVIVLDDPFTDMDPERTEKSCRLIKEFAKKHQVIFLTCKDEYIDMLSGNTIRI